MSKVASLASFRQKKEKEKKDRAQDEKMEKIFDEIEQNNKIKKERLAEERKKANEQIKRSYRLKR